MNSQWIRTRFQGSELRSYQRHRCAQQAGDLGVVTARVRGARGRIRLGMARDDQGVELAQHRERRAVARPAREVRAYAGELLGEADALGALFGGRRSASVTRSSGACA